MTSRGNRTAVTRLALTFLAVAVLVVGAACYQLIAINNLTISYRSLIDRDIHRVLLLHDISIANKDLRNKSNRYIVNGFEPEHRIELLARIDTLSAATEEFGSASENEETEEDSANEARMEELIALMVEQATAISDMTPSDPQADAAARAAINATEMELSDLLAVFMEREEEELVETEYEIEEAVSHLFGTVVIVAVAVVLLTIGLSIFMTWRLRRFMEEGR